MRRKYEDLIVRFRFEPVAVETAGVLGKTTELLLNEIGRRMSVIAGGCKETYWLAQGLGLAVQRGSALSIQAAVRERHGVEWI